MSERATRLAAVVVIALFAGLVLFAIVRRTDDGWGPPPARENAPGPSSGGGPLDHAEAV